MVKDGANYRLGPAVLGEPLDKLDELIADLLKTGDLVRTYKRNLP